MAFEELKKSLLEVDINVRSYIESNKEYYQLKGFKVLMKGITSLTKLLLVGSVVLLAMLFLSFAAAFGIGQALDNTFYGFLIVGAFFVLVSIILYLLRNKLDKPLLKKFSKYYFDKI
ncbi:MAG: hypothetical protein L3J25_06675 [Flavobacteriaceae bacterium]|nr:hypothetical protein [Flavobacteriaceae bacterium]